VHRFQHLEEHHALDRSEPEFQQRALQAESGAFPPKIICDLVELRRSPRTLLAKLSHEAVLQRATTRRS
jgi:hypothetical protein